MITCLLLEQDASKVALCIEVQGFLKRLIGEKASQDPFGLVQGI